MLPFELLVFPAFGFIAHRPLTISKTTDLVVFIWCNCKSVFVLRKNVFCSCGVYCKKQLNKHNNTALMLETEITIKIPPTSDNSNVHVLISWLYKWIFGTGTQTNAIYQFNWFLLTAIFISDSTWRQYGDAIFRVALLEPQSSILPWFNLLKNKSLP